jgi:hypothetical protein
LINNTSFLKEKKLEELGRQQKLKTIFARIQGENLYSIELIQSFNP